ncbi:MAG: glycosyltransferase family 39 protein [Bacteroidales bacterium]|nr:MAG: glycosyltransferase family 39 protein [Bacteroidales bacterium]
MKTIRQFLLRPYLYLIIIIIGTVLKFYRLDHKLFWFDEICTVQHTSGIPDYKYPGLVPLNEIKNISFYNDLYHLNKQDYTIALQLKGLFSSTQLTPLHYSFLVFWHRIVGDDKIDYRLFGVFIFILTLPFLFLLARQLFKSNLAGWVAVSLYAVSPYINLFAQEARYYILLAFFIVILHYLFLLFVQHKKVKWLIAYSIIAIMAMYTSFISGVIIFGHFIYVCLLKKDLCLKYSISLFAIFIVYAPWIYSMYIDFHEISVSLSWHSQPESLPVIMTIMGQITFFISIFEFLIDYSLIYIDNMIAFSPVIILGFVTNILILILLIIAFIYFFRKSRMEEKLFAILIILPGFILFFVYDIVRSAIASWWWRYHIFNVFGIILVVTYLLFRKIEKGKLAFSGIFTGLVIIGIFSVLTISNSRYWYHGGYLQQVYIEDARLFSKADKPVIITDYSFGFGMVDFMVVINECNSDNIDILRASNDIENVEEILIYNNYSEIYVTHASNELTENLKSQFGEKMDSLKIEGISPMWQINLD